MLPSGLHGCKIGRNLVSRAREIVHGPARRPRRLSFSRASLTHALCLARSPVTFSPRVWKRLTTCLRFCQLASSAETAISSRRAHALPFRVPRARTGWRITRARDWGGKSSLRATEVTLLRKEPSRRDTRARPLYGVL